MLVRRWYCDGAILLVLGWYEVGTSRRGRRRQKTTADKFSRAFESLPSRTQGEHIGKCNLSFRFPPNPMSGKCFVELITSIKINQQAESTP